MSLVFLWRLVDSSVECRDKSESRWRQIDAKRTPCDARAAFSEEIYKIAVFCLLYRYSHQGVPVHFSRLRAGCSRVELGWSFRCRRRAAEPSGIRLLPLHREEAGRGGVFSVLDVALALDSLSSVSARTRRRNVGFRRDLVRWIQDFERNPWSPYLLDLLKGDFELELDTLVFPVDLGIFGDLLAAGV
uniref:Uncharacterized protein n=1 Tax=Ananas comosus var. bracteatus TaxID=296719 RepID=A0A6V7Q2F7_ANACO|nr:unnamed protein product [Ananas comosus var. bracteatus]